MQAFRLLWFLVIFHYGLCLTAQEKDPGIQLALQLDSMSGSSGIHRHFAKLYTETVLLSMQHYQQAPENELHFLRRFEQSFAGYFFRAAASNGLGPGTEAWQIYFRDSTLSPLQYQLLGINAHINADLSATLTGGFTLEELKAHKKSFLRFQTALRYQFQAFYDENVQANNLTRLLNKLSFGLARPYGSLMMSRWRKRQYRLAIWHTTHPGKAVRLKRKTDRHKERVDQLILRHL